MHISYKDIEIENLFQRF